MSVSGIGSRNTYIYNARTGKLAAKNGEKDDFVDYFNGERTEEEADALNGFDAVKKSDIEHLIGVWTQFDRNLFHDPAREEYEITTEIVDAVTSTCTVDGRKVFTCYNGSFFSGVDFSALNHAGPFRTQEHKDYDPYDNSVNIAVGDVFDLGNGYKLTVGKDAVYGEGYGTNNGVNDQKMKCLEQGLGALIHFADQQWSAGMIGMMGEGATPMLLAMLRELGVDTDREFIINGTKCEVRGGRIHEAGNRWVVPSSVQNEAIKKYEEMLYRPLSERK